VEVAVAPADPTKLVWTGAIDSMWTRIGNWDNPCAIPTTGDTVIVPPGATVPVFVPTIQLSVLELDNHAGLVLGGFLQITEELRLLAGHVTCGNFDLYLGSGAFTSNASHVSFVVTNGSGRLVKNGIGLGGPPFLFPVGFSTTDYVPVTLQNKGGTDQFGIRVTPGVLQDGTSGTPLAGDVVGVTWHIDEQAPGGSDVTIKFQWDGKHELSSFDQQHCAVAHFAGTSWSVLQNYGPSQGATSFTRTVGNVSNFSPFAVTDSSSTIPVELSAFYASKSGRDVLLYWQTETETDNLGFEIQRRQADLDSWETLSFVPGAGTATTQHQYRYLDRPPAAGRWSYRLRQLDFSGQAAHSHEIAVDVFAAAREFAVMQNYPNPFNPTTHISWQQPESSPVRLAVFNSLGKCVFETAIGIHGPGTHQYRWTVPAGLGGGIYHYRLHTRFGSAGGAMLYLP